MILFDYGGTLDTRARHWAHVLWDGYRHACIPVTKAQFKDAYVYGERALARNPVIQPDDDFRSLLAKKIGLETEFLIEQAHWSPSEEERLTVCEAATDFCDAYARRCTAESRIVLETLRQQGERMAIVSNFYGNLNAVLQGYGLKEFFPTVVESAVVGVRKPDPAIFSLGIKAAGQPASQTVAVGDSYTKDILPARQAGCRTVWFKGEGWTDEEHDESIADAVITSLDQLPTALAALWQG